MKREHDDDEIPVLIGCECSGVIREAFRARGIQAWSCDLKPDEHQRIIESWRDGR